MGLAQKVNARHPFVGSNRDNLRWNLDEWRCEEDIPREVNLMSKCGDKGNKKNMKVDKAGAQG